MHTNSIRKGCTLIVIRKASTFTVIRKRGRKLLINYSYSTIKVRIEMDCANEQIMR